MSKTSEIGAATQPQEPAKPDSLGLGPSARSSFRSSLTVALLRLVRYSLQNFAPHPISEVWGWTTTGRFAPRSTPSHPIPFQEFRGGLPWLTRGHRIASGVGGLRTSAIVQFAVRSTPSRPSPFQRFALALVLLSVLILPLAAHAQDSGILPDCTKNGDCQLTEFLQGFVNLANYGLGILGFVAVTMFIVGGIYLLLSAGRATMVARGKSILAGATTGILIILFSWVSIGFVYVALTGDSEGTIFAGTKNAFNFFKTAGNKPAQQTTVTCQPFAKDGITLGCTEADANGPIHRISIILNSKPGCSVGAIKSTYDTAMESAIKDFQDANNLPVNGVVDLPTWDALWNGDADCFSTVQLSGASVPTVPDPKQCCKVSDATVGSCAIAVVPQGSDSSLCGPGFQSSIKPCNDFSTTANLTECAPSWPVDNWGTCSYVFSSPPFSPSQRTWRTGTLACNAVGGTITP